MGNIEWLGLFFAGIALGTRVVKKTTNALSESVKVGDISVEFYGGNFTGKFATIYVPIINDLPISVDIESVPVSVFYGNIDVADLELTESITIEASEITVMAFDTFISYSDLGADILNVIQSGTYIQNMSVRGTIHTSNSKIPNIPIDQPIQLL